MRIIGGHDYYDTAQAYGHDPKVVFVRDEKKYAPEKEFNRPYCGVYFVPPNEVKKDFHWKYKSNVLKDKNGTWNIFTVRMIFCGVHYSGIRCTYMPNYWGSPEDDLYFWDRDEFNKWVNTFNLVPVFKGRWMHDEKNMSCIPNRLVGEEYNYLVKNRVSIAIFRGEREGWELNCSGLRNIHFFKVFDSVTAFQELDMWMSGALGMPGNPMVEVSDDIRMQKHGMDKWSFRKKVR